MEKMITVLSPDGNRAFFDTAAFPWVARIEQGWTRIRAELDVLLAERDRIPNFQDISRDQALLTEGTEWKTFFFFAYGHEAERNCARCPETLRLLRFIPGLKTAMFSILAPGKHIPEHRGPYKGVLRYHLGLVIPRPAGDCRIRVRDEVRVWEEGKSLIFDDSHLHEAWNDSGSYRVVLFVDFVRPLPFPLSVLNRLVLRRIAGAEFVTSAIDRVRQYALDAPADGAGEKSRSARV
jgi:beta-hydroxylase